MISILETAKSPEELEPENDRKKALNIGNPIINIESEYYGSNLYVYKYFRIEIIANSEVHNVSVKLQEVKPLDDAIKFLTVFSFLPMELRLANKSREASVEVLYPNDKVLIDVFRVNHRWLQSGDAMVQFCGKDIPINPEEARREGLSVRVNKEWIELDDYELTIFVGAEGVQSTTKTLRVEPSDGDVKFYSL